MLSLVFSLIQVNRISINNNPIKNNMSKAHKWSFKSNVFSLSTKHLPRNTDTVNQTALLPENITLRKPKPLCDICFSSRGDEKHVHADFYLLYGTRLAFLLFR